MDDECILTSLNPKKQISKFDNYMKLNIDDTNQIDENADPGNEMAEEENEYYIIKNNHEQRYF